MRDSSHVLRSQGQQERRGDVPQPRSSLGTVPQPPPSPAGDVQPLHPAAPAHLGRAPWGAGAGRRVMEGNKWAQRMEIWCRAFPAPVLNGISLCTCAFPFPHHSPINQQPLCPGDGMGAAFWHLAAAPGLQASHSGVCPSCSSWPDRHPALSHQAGPAQELVSELTPSTKPEALGTPTAPLHPLAAPPASCASVKPQAGSRCCSSLPVPTSTRYPACPRQLAVISPHRVTSSSSSSLSAQPNKQTNNPGPSQPEEN